LIIISIERAVLAYLGRLELLAQPPQHLVRGRRADLAPARHHPSLRRHCVGSCSVVHRAAMIRVETDEATGAKADLF
jgi:hypothetical protein